MKELFDKISSYNLFNYLLPGIVFTGLANVTTHYSFIQEDVLIGPFMYYFLGMVISRFGSLVIEPLLKKISFVHFANYAEYVAASRKDTTLELLSEVNNTYRTFCSMFVLLTLLKLYEMISQLIPVIQKWTFAALILLLLIMFLFSYRKQTNYITKRIKANE